MPSAKSLDLITAKDCLWANPTDIEAIRQIPMRKVVSTLQFFKFHKSYSHQKCKEPLISVHGV